jgi:aspartyl-tRNA synthetase
VFRGTEFGVAAAVLDAGGRFRGLVAPGGARLSRREQDELQALARGAGAQGAIFLKRVDGRLRGRPRSSCGPTPADALGLADGDLAVIVAGPDRLTSPALDRVRQDVARRLALVPDGALELLWWSTSRCSSATRRRAPSRRCTTRSRRRSRTTYRSWPTEPWRARARAYDVVLNGTELGGGSIRISDARSRPASSPCSASTRRRRRRASASCWKRCVRGAAARRDRVRVRPDRHAARRGRLAPDVIAFPKTTAARALFEGAPTAGPG